MVWFGYHVKLLAMTGRPRQLYKGPLEPSILVLLLILKHTQLLSQFNDYSPQSPLLAQHQPSTSSILHIHPTFKMSFNPVVPEMQWAQVFEVSNGPITYKQIPVAKPASDEVLVNITYSGVCHTDLHVRIPPSSRINLKADPVTDFCVE